MDDLFDAKVKEEAEKMLQVIKQKELDRIISDPDLVISAYQKKLEETKLKLIETTKKFDVVSKNYNTLVDIGENYEMKNAAKLIKFIRSDGKQVGRNQLFDFLIDMEILCKDKTPKQSYLDRKWFDLVIEPWQSGSLSGTYNKTVVTILGIEKIRELLESSFETWWSE